MSVFHGKKGRKTDWHKKCRVEIDFLSDLNLNIKTICLK